jgi:positive regulator of sigma E activity
MIGRIHAAAGGKILVVPAEKTACFGCLKDCGKRGVVVVENQDALPLKPGQMVETGHSPRSLLFQGLAALLPLVLGFTAGFFLTHRLFPSAGEGARAAGGVFLLFAGGAAALLIRRRYPAKETSRIKRIITGDQPSLINKTTL